MLEVGLFAQWSWDCNSYPSDYRTALAFSSVPLPAIPWTSLAEAPAAEAAECRVYHVSLKQWWMI